MAPTPPDRVVVHPLVLLSVVDHYNRVAKDTKKRVLGVLLGESSKGKVDATNSFAGAPPAAAPCGRRPAVTPRGRSPPRRPAANHAPLPSPAPAVPFEEDEKDPSIWFLDHSYLENMFRMFKKVNGAPRAAAPPRPARPPPRPLPSNPPLPPARAPPSPSHAARERIIGWYHTGPRLREADLDINQLVAGYCDAPVLVICEVAPKEMGLPVAAYLAREEVREDGTEKSKRVFANLPTEVGATEAEEIGVEHLLRGVKDVTLSTLSTDVGEMVTGLRSLRSRLGEVGQYLEAVVQGRLPVNHEVMRNLQDVFNLLPNLGAAELARSFAAESNDMMMAVYLSSLIRSVIALHNLIDNKEARAAQEAERVAGGKGQDKAAAAGEAKGEAKAGGEGKAEGGDAKPGSSK
jgi:26S proteasome regulatory subunit N8